MSDVEDEAQDWRALSRVQNSAVLKRGDKEYAPDGTQSQVSMLDACRESMYTALEHSRVHAEKSVVYARWCGEARRFKIDKPKGTYFYTMGTSERGIIVLEPEEAVYLVQRGSMVCLFNGNAMSVEAVCALCLNQVSLEKMLVYSYLRKLGYIVRRPRPSAPQDKAASGWLTGWLGWPQWPGWSGLSGLSGRSPYSGRAAWASRSWYSTYAAIYGDLQFIRAAENTERPAAAMDFHVWKPATKFKKSQPENPDFNIKVLNAGDGLPSLETTRALFSSLPKARSQKRSVVTRIREGRRQLVLVVVDSGVVNFLRLVDSEFESALEGPPPKPLQKPLQKPKRR